MPIWQQFWFTGQNNMLNPLSQTIPQTWFNNTNYANSRYPWLDEDELKKLEQAAKDAGYTWNNLQKGMDIIYQNWINKFNNNKKLEERDWLINKQCFETAQYSGKDKNLREQQDRVTVLAQSIKRAYPKIKADYDDCEVINAYVTWKWFQEEYDNYIRNWDKTILEELQWKSRGSYTEPDKNFWATNAGMFTTLGIWAGGVWATAYFWPKALKTLTKWVREKAGRIAWNLIWDLGWDIEWAVDLEKIGKGLYSEVVEPSEKDLRMTQSAEWDRLLLKDRQKSLKEAEAKLSKAIKWGNDEEIKAAQQVVDDLKWKVTKLTSKVEKWADTLSDTAMRYNLFWTTTSIWNQANYNQKKLWQDTISPLLEKSDYRINLNWIVDDVCDRFINNIDWIAGEDPEAIERLRWAAEKIKNSYKNVDYTDIDAIHANNIKSEIAQRNVKYYDSLAKGWTVDEVKEAETLVREAILKEIRWEIYNAWDSVLKTMWDDWVKMRQLLKDYWDLEQIAQNALKWEKPTWIAWVKNWVSQNIKTRAGKFLVEKGKEAKQWAQASKAAKGTEEVVEDVAKAAKGWKLRNLLKWWLKSIIKWGKLFTILEDWSIIPWSPTNMASKNIDKIIEWMVYRKTKKNNEEVNQAYDEFMEQYNSIPENERTKLDEISKDIMDWAKRKMNKKESKQRWTLTDEIKDTLWNWAYKDYLNGDRETFDEIYTDELIEKVINWEEELPIFA